jgi:hypothetical protein
LPRNSLLSVPVVFLLFGRFLDFFFFLLLLFFFLLLFFLFLLNANG